MNVLILSNSASFHQVANLLENQDSVDSVFHYGANPNNKFTNKYFPTFIDLAPTGSVEDSVKTILSDIDYKKIDLALVSGVPLSNSQTLYSYLSAKKIPNLLPGPKLATLETNRITTKKLLQLLDIPCSLGERYTGWKLFRDFFKIATPFVVKIEKKYFFGRQTIIVNDDNRDRIFYQLFGRYANQEGSVFNIEFDDNLIVEKYIDLEYEISYHAILNSKSWTYLGSARDYKKEFDQDLGDLTDGMGSYFIESVDDRVHNYIEKIHSYLNNIGKPFRGFLFLGIGVAKDGVPYVLEINTRSGDPEIASIAPSVENFLDILVSSAANKEIPKVVFNNKKTVSVVIKNKELDFTKPATDIPVFKDIPKNISFGLSGDIKFKVRHSLFSCSSNDLNDSAKQIYSYLDKQKLGQFYYRKDIGLLK